ncbi:Phospho-N-acetylmuramoyl-pentapeptide-transferase [uncultured archaeon]|nr:Phospho-N-acetylmuramoyl-pentapeptide-transferase [uncultured archaeon]
METSLILLTIISSCVGFIVSFLLIPKFKTFLHNIDILAIDQQKKEKPRIATSGGIPIAIGFFTAIMVFLILKTYFPLTFNFNINYDYILAACLTSLFIALVGFFDDIYLKKVKTKTNDTAEYRIGLSQWMKPLITLQAALPLVVIINNYSNLAIPFIGKIELGVIIPLIIIPIVIMGVSNAFNMFAGKNGLEAGLGIQAFLFLGLIGITLGKNEMTLLCFISMACLLAFLKFNWYPASILPGDSLTYFTGGAFASAIILGGSQVIFYAGIIFIPWILEAILKLRGNFKKKSLGELQKDGTLKAPYDKIYSLNHIVMKIPEWFDMKRRFKESEIAVILISFASLFSLAAFILVTIL